MNFKSLRGEAIGLDPQVMARKAYLIGTLELLCQALELTDAQLAEAERRYLGVGQWLAGADSPLLRTLSIYLQGSTAIGTTVKPIASNEHDVDLVANLRAQATYPPGLVKDAIGERLRQHGSYSRILEEKPRCWRLAYANEFHLDITPSIPNPACSNGGELVPDKAVRDWKASNPKGYRALFEQRAALVPRIRTRVMPEFGVAAKRADIEPYPAPSAFKGFLRRTVQIGKRHRDVHFANDKDGLAPISVIVTTLASRSYEYCVTNFIYDTELDLLLDVVGRMPDFIEHQQTAAGPMWFIWNETTAGENFAEKWNRDPKLAKAFFAWHARAVLDLEELARAVGLDLLTKNLNRAFGSVPTTKVMAAMTRQVSDNRRDGLLAVAPRIGLCAAATAAVSTRVRANTFFGADCA
ncbi:MAG: nucleotidyltransferase [Proteobacteria bacterium]|nr:nucleotidyltransferase [Pseudomonadota bacterium]